MQISHGFSVHFPILTCQSIFEISFSDCFSAFSLCDYLCTFNFHMVEHFNFLIPLPSEYFSFYRICKSNWLIVSTFFVLNFISFCEFFPEGKIYRWIEHFKVSISFYSIPIRLICYLWARMTRYHWMIKNVAFYLGWQPKKCRERFFILHLITSVFFQLGTIKPFLSFLDSCVRAFDLYQGFMSPSNVGWAYRVCMCRISEQCQ